MLNLDLVVYQQNLSTATWHWADLPSGHLPYRLTPTTIWISILPKKHTRWKGNLTLCG